MIDRYTRPYRFIPPYKGAIWNPLTNRLMLRRMRKTFGVVRWDMQGLDHLRDSLDRKAGIVLAPNHSRYPDPISIGLASWELRQPLFYMASYHLFAGRLNTWLMRRMGSYSVYREGADRESIRTTVDLLTEAKRPIVLFPEGTWYRQNDRIGPLLEGLSLIARQAAKGTERPLVVHPVGMKYWALRDARPALAARLGALEANLGWPTKDSVPLVARIERLSSALLATREVEVFGGPGQGDVDERRVRLIEGLVARHEEAHMGHTFPGGPMERVRRLRQALVKKLHEPGGDRTVEGALNDLLLAENLNGHSQEYLTEWPSHERLIETVQRLEETVHDKVERPIVPMGLVVRIGPPLDARTLSAGRPARGSGEPTFTVRLRQEMQGLVDALLADGPPSAWQCPAALAPRPQPTGRPATPTVELSSVEPTSLQPTTT